MQQEFAIFVRELFMRIGVSAKALFETVLGALGGLPPEFPLLLGAFSVILLLRIPFLRSIALSPFLLLRPILQLFGLFTEREPWSVVYDSKTKYPLDPVYVSVRDTLGTEVASAVTDLEGRFGVVLSRGTYTISVQKTNYSFPSKRLQGKTSDGYHNQLYFGGNITILDKERVIDFHIPMDPEGVDWNQKEKKRMKLFGIFRRKKSIAEGALFFGVVGALIALAQYRISPSVDTQQVAIFYGMLLFVFFALSLFRNDTLQHSVVLDKHTKEPVPFARIKLFTKEKKFQVAKRITTLSGQFVCLLSPGAYYAIIEKRMPDGSYQEVHTTGAFTVKDGYIHKKFVV